MKKIANYFSVINIIGFFSGLVSVGFLNGSFHTSSVIDFFIFAISSASCIIALFGLTDKRLRIPVIMVTLIAIFFTMANYYAAFVTWDWSMG